MNIQINAKTAWARFIRLPMQIVQATTLLVMAFCLLGLLMQLIPALPQLWRPPGNLPMILLSLAGTWIALHYRAK